MPVYRIEAYELWTNVYDVEADNASDAIDRFYAGEGDLVDNAGQYVEIANQYGVHPHNAAIDKQTAEELRTANELEVLDGIYSVERIED